MVREEAVLVRQPARLGGWPDHEWQRGRVSIAEDACDGVRGQAGKAQPALAGYGTWLSSVRMLWMWVEIISLEISYTGICCGKRRRAAFIMGRINSSDSAM